MERILTALTVAMLAAGAAVAQPADTFVIAGGSSSAPGGVFQISDTGTVLRTIAAFPSYQTSFSPVALRGDNQSFLAVQFTGGWPNQQYILLDLQPNGTVTTVYGGSKLFYFYGLARNWDGDWFVMSNPSTRGGALTLLSTTAGQLACIGNIVLDEETGQLLVKGSKVFSPAAYGFFRVDPYTGAVTAYHTWVNQPGCYYNVHYGSWDTIYDFASNTALHNFGDLTFWARTGRITPGRGIQWLSKPWWGRSSYGFVRAGQRTPGVAYWVLNKAGNELGGAARNWDLVPVRADGTWGKSEYLKGNPPLVMSRLIRMGSRHLAWHMVQRPNGRTLQLSFPGEAGRPYVVGLSQSGIRPGVPLPDGRVVPIVPDPLTALSLRGGLPGVLEQTTGTLDTSGRAVVTIDTNRFGSTLKGQKLWAAALVLDPAASAGVAYIVGPTLLSIRD